MNDKQKIRKQMYDLTEADYREYAVWEFCLDEESVEGQDETTVRPSALRELPADSHGMFLVAADVLFGDGSRHLGYLFSDEHDVNGAMGAVFVNESAVIFSVPGLITSERAGKFIEDQYRNLAMDRKAVFPVSFASVIPIAGRPLSFELDGFIIDGGPRKGETVR